ncbi:hypothetical protein SORBI_3008G148900 [Sorghum bicolor]|uniref:TF-B3 domain-containing protein n=1 Tax=Sorghum bicolor TaxID=4558 RepID=A0A1Z5R7B7_SORBI|nr:hypothetical protein SORBI_3008G148900 [Sorghum bicolor]
MEKPQRMSTYLTRCKDCIVHHYWNHMDDQEKSFLSVMIGDYVALPKKITNNIRGQIQEVVKLQVADGKTYDIQIDKEPNGLVFGSGWAKFASAYELEQGDMLVFRYSRNCLFKVQIFDPNGCEKEFSCFKVNSSSSVEGRCGHGMSKASYNTICKERAAHHYWNQMHNKCSFVVMLDSGFKNGLILREKYAKNVGDQISETITLKVLDGETYDIEVTKKNNELLLCFGWVAFANAYELEQGDTLVFRYSGESHFEVQIFSPSTCEKELSCFLTNSIPCVQERITSHDNHLQSPGSERRNKACTVCKNCISNHYWHHMSDQDRCFIKIMISASDFKNKLTIPKKFATNVGGQIPEEVQLEAPNGKTYNVKVAKEQNDLVIGTGWTKFSSSHDLRQGDLLVFTYSGYAHFKVRIFDPSNCEKEFSCVVMDNFPYGQERSISHDNHTQPSTSNMLVKHCSGSSSHKRKTLKTSPTDSPSRKSTEDDDVKEPLNSVGFQKSWLVFPMGCNMNSEQRAKIDALEQKIRPQIPLYITTMDMTSVSSGILAISKDYAVKHLLDKNGTITLSQLNGSKTWAITLDINTVGWYARSTGWLDFICNNGLKEGDICIFEPSKGKSRVTLIFHPLEETHHPKSAGYVPSSRSPPHEATEPGYIVPRFTVLNNEQMYKIKNKVQAIGSPYSVFVRIMKPGDVTPNNCIMRFCSAYDKKYLQRGQDTMSLIYPNKTHTWEAEIKISNNS